METLTGEKVYIVKATLGKTKGILGVFNNVQSAEQFAQDKYQEWTQDRRFTWNKGQTAKRVFIKVPSQKSPIKGGLLISKYLVRSK